MCNALREAKILSHTSLPNSSGFIIIPLVEQSNPLTVGNLICSKKKKNT